MESEKCIPERKREHYSFFSKSLTFLGSLLGLILGKNSIRFDIWQLFSIKDNFRHYMLNFFQRTITLP